MHCCNVVNEMKVKWCPVDPPDIGPPTSFVHRRVIVLFSVSIVHVTVLYMYSPFVWHLYYCRKAWSLGKGVPLSLLGELFLLAVNLGAGVVIFHQ